MLKRLVAAVLLIWISIQVSSQGVVSVEPSSAPAGTVSLNVTAGIDPAAVPPSTVLPSSFTIGTVSGTNLVRNGNNVSADFAFTGIPAGSYNVSVTFPGPPPGYTPVTFTMVSGFELKDTTVFTATSWNIAGTNVSLCYDTLAAIPCPTNPGAPFYGQTNGTALSYLDNGDGTVTDLVTGLMWQQDPGPKKTYAEAVSGASTLTLGGYSDWRLPSIKELYSLIQFSGVDPSVPPGTPLSQLTPFIDSNFFVFHYGDTTAGERIIDSQYWSATNYVATTMGGDHSVFGVNFADGRIKSYPKQTMTGANKQYVLYVREHSGYGINAFVDNGDSTVTDTATSLMWAKYDAGQTMNWESALAWVQGRNSMHYLGYSDWRLPTVKELESIVDYSKAPATTNSPAIDSVFICTPITNEAGQSDYGCYWSSTTHVNYTGMARNAAYVAFGRAMGYFNGSWQDVHGAGAQRSDPKQGDPANYPYGNGPQGDAIRINNFVRCVRDADGTTGIPEDVRSYSPLKIHPNPANGEFMIILKSEKAGMVTIVIRDLFGKIVSESCGESDSTGTFHLRYRLEAAPGIYFVQVTGNGITRMEKLILSR